jgi:hypothetical protein
MHDNTQGGNNTLIAGAGGGHHGWRCRRHVRPCNRRE